MIRPDRAEVRAAIVADDLSFHRVWWRRKWVLFYDEPRTLENARPWTHHVPAAFHVLPILLAGGLWALGTAWWPVAIAMSVVAAIYLTTVIAAEARFAKWTRGHDSKVLLEAFLPPRAHHPLFESSSAAQLATSELAGSQAVIEDYARSHGAHLRGYRKYGTPGYVRISALAGTLDPLLRAIDAAASFRQINEGWGSEKDWDAAFTAASSEPGRTKWLRKVVPTAGDKEATRYEALAYAVTDTLRALTKDTETMPAAAAIERLQPAPEPTPALAKAPTTVESYGGGGGPFVVIGSTALGIMALGIIVASVGVLAVPGLVKAAQGADVSAGLHNYCVVEAIDKVQGDHTLVNTSCGTIRVPNVLAGQLIPSEKYDVEVHELEGEKIAIPLNLHER
ncbi:hypothetical protein [Microbacterium sp. 77mftsu3.1]|uniref:hypothetical protein n=1 Tax=Microbacterium sp. 77mftsu3.1 TaxID=1761802 RepID=UPI00039B5859|nr:hypothetical protein [Microbacterium sp. 77mftsu3.1]